MTKFPAPEELEFDAVRSRGPGGQNVNKTNSASVLRWNLVRSRLPDAVKSRLFEKLGGQLTAEGDLLFRSDVHRDLEQNRKACIEKLHQTIEKALFVPKKRIKTKPSRSAVRKRLDSKKKHSDKKRGRQGSWGD